MISSEGLPATVLAESFQFVGGNEGAGTGVPPRPKAAGNEEEGGGGECAGVRSVGVPSLREALVEIGNKPPDFVGSCEWIGTFEACLVLDHLFSVSFSTQFSFHTTAICTISQ